MTKYQLEDMKSQESLCMCRLPESKNKSHNTKVLQRKACDGLCAPSGLRCLEVASALAARPTTNYPLTMCNVTPEPDLSELDAELRGLLASEWTRLAVEEHQRLQGRAKWTLYLLAVGAPNQLLRAVSLAAADHASSAQTYSVLADCYSEQGLLQRAVELTAAAPQRPIQIVPDLARVAAAIAQEWCIGDTVSLMVTAAAAHAAKDPVIQEALELIVEREKVHSLLSWRVVRWALENGDARVRSALEDVFDDGLAFAMRCSQLSRDLTCHGFLNKEDAEETSRSVLEHIVIPCSGQLLASSVGKELEMLSCERLTHMRNAVLAVLS